MNWTPGPWGACLDESDGGNESTEIRAQDSLIANVYGARDFPCITDEDTEIPPAEFAANALLIAAAPAMYEALSDLVKGHDNPSQVFEALRKAESALAQARGETAFK